MEQNEIDVLKIGLWQQKLVNVYLVRALRNTQVKITDYFGQMENAVPPQKIDFDREYIACALELAAQAAGFELALKKMTSIGPPSLEIFKQGKGGMYYADQASSA